MQPTTSTAKPPLTLGYKASAEQFHPRRLLDLAIAAERAGYDSVWTSDHFQPWRHTDGHAPNALVWLGAAAASTTRVTLGTSVLTPSFRYNPAIVAQAFATLSCLAEDRIILGVGTGESMNEVPVGIDWPEQGERFARLREAITLIKELWAEEFVTFEGQFFKTHEATVYDRPEEPRADLHRRLRARRRPPRGARSATASSAPAARARSCTRRRSCRASPRAPRRRAATCRAWTA